MEPESDPAASSSLHSPGELTTRTHGAPRARSTSMRIPAVSRRPAPAPLCGTRSASAPACCTGAPARRASTTCNDPTQEPGVTAGTKAAALPAKPSAAQARVFKARHIRVSHKESKPRPDRWSRAPCVYQILRHGIATKKHKLVFDHGAKKHKQREVASTHSWHLLQRRNGKNCTSYSQAVPLGGGTVPSAALVPCDSTARGGAHVDRDAGCPRSRQAE